MNDLLWIFSRLIGINISKTPPKTTIKYCSYVCVFILLLLCINATYLGVAFSSNEITRWKTSVPLLVQIPLLIYLWYFLRSKRKAFLHINCKFDIIMAYENTQKKKQVICSILLLVILAIPLIISFFFVHLHLNKTDNGRAFEVVMLTNNEIINTILISTTTISYYGIWVSLPCYAVLFVCYFVMRCRNMLKHYCKRFRKIDLNIHSAETHHIVKEYFFIRKIIQELNRILSTPFMIIFACSLLSLFSSFTTVLVIRETTFDLVFSYATFLTIEPIKLMIITIFVSKIPEFFSEMKSKVTNMIDNSKIELLRNTELFFMLKRIENKDLIYLTVGSIFNISKEFLFTTLGSLLTYSLLLISVN